MLDGIWPYSSWNGQQTRAKNIGPAKVMGPVEEEEVISAYFSIKIVYNLTLDDYDV